MRDAPAAMSCYGERLMDSNKVGISGLLRAEDAGLQQGWARIVRRSEHLLQLMNDQNMSHADDVNSCTKKTLKASSCDLVNPT